MTVDRFRIFTSRTRSEIIAQRGGGLVEILLALVIISVATPFTYSMISETTHTMHNMAIAKDILSLHDEVLNFVRINQDLWPSTAQIKMSDEELAEFSENISVGFIDKYSVHSGTVIDVYLAFDFDMPTKRLAQIATNLGGDAAIVGPDKIAYGDSWAVMAPEFNPGDLIYKISRNLSDTDTARFLHRGAAAGDDFNVMERDLNMGGYDVYNVGGIDGTSVRVRNLNATFINATELAAKNVYFSSGANMNADNVSIGTLRVSGDISGFRNIDGRTLNGSAFTTNGHVIADRATINESINVGNNLVLKSTSVRTVNGFIGMTVGSMYAPYITTKEIMFLENYGLTVSGELLMSSNAPIRLGSWVFPSTVSPTFKNLNLTRSSIPSVPNKNEFSDLIKDGWQTR